MSFRGLALPFAVSLVAGAPAALAHVQIKAPRQRHVEQKTGPCGVANSTRGANVCEYRPGATITVEWDETVEHPGHFRVSFDQDGIDDFLDPSGYEDYDNSEAVLEDAIPDRDVDQDGNETYSIQVQLPDVECDGCTLQLIQVMTDKMPWGPEGGNDIYYQCADIVLSNDAP
ncbi:MAG TPA: SCE4755 family polysaccharide monooxygenase-like protein, partial [Kofleriaceae bacterium]|nr:SCE4755 family polysaccharide monooxygenase-like protein [Kofleriaceae bacterium]